MTRALVALALVAAASARDASSASAAPWSFELPAGYVEQPAGREFENERLARELRNASVDAQAYRSADGDVRLVRITWRSRLDVAPTRRVLERLDESFSAHAAERGTSTSASRKMVGDQLVGEQVIDTRALRTHVRRLHAASRDRVVTTFAILCAGPKYALAACEHAQQTMTLVLPDPAALTSALDGKTDFAFIARIVAGVVLAFAVLYMLARARYR